MSISAFKKGAAFLAAAILLSPISVQADWNQNNDEANRQRIMSDMRQTQVNNDRANADAQFSAGLRSQSSGSSSTGSGSSSSNGGSSPAYAPRNHDDTDTGERTVVATRTLVVGATETAENFFVRTSQDANSGSAKAQFDLGRMYYAGYGTARNDVQARRWLGEAAKQGHVLAAAMHASVLQYGIGGPVDMVAARKSYAVAANGGDARSMAELGMMHMQGAAGLAQNRAEAVRLWTKSSELGDSAGMAGLGEVYLYGVPGFAAQPKEGLRLMKKAAELGERNAMLIYAKLLNNGELMPKDLQGAIRYARAAAELGHSDGQSMMAIYYYLGDGVPQSYEQAARWAKLSASSGNAEGQTTLGTMYYFGQGVSKDIKEAARWFQKAAAQGNEMAINNMKEPDIIEAAKGL